MKIILFLAVLIMSTSCNPNIQEKSEQKYNKIITKYTEIRQIISNEVNDTFYVFVKLPKHYQENIEKKYTTLYLLDGDISFNMASSVVRYLQYGKDIPNLILVAPAYGTMLNDSETNYRERDYTISKFKELERSGEANNYIKFLSNELIPVIEGSYRTNGKKIINGYSIGGLLTINILLNEPALFNGYIAGSPYLSNDLELLLKQADNLSAISKDIKFFISVGELENKDEYYFPIKELLKKIRKNSDITISFNEFKNGTHFTCPSEALAYGLKFIFKQN